MKVIVIDDSEISLALTMGALETAGIEVVGLTSPLGAAAALAQERPDLVLLDMDMPALSGEKAASILKRQRSLAHLKVILYSDRDESALAAAVTRCGANGFLRKTQNLSLLVSEVRRLAAAP